MWRGSLSHPKTPLSDLLLACPFFDLPLPLPFSSTTCLFLSLPLCRSRSIHASGVFSRAVNLEWRYENRRPSGGLNETSLLSKRLLDVSWRQRRRPTRECRAGACDPRSRASRSRDYTRNFIRVPRSSRSDPPLTRKERVGYGISNCLYRSAITEKIRFLDEVITSKRWFFHRSIRSDTVRHIENLDV